MFTKQYQIISHLYSDMFEDIHETREWVEGEQMMVGKKVFREADCSHDLINLLSPRLINNLYLLVT